MSRIRLTESQLHNVIRRCVNEALKEDLHTDNTEIGDGSFPNPSAMVDDKFSRVRQALVLAGYKLVEYGDDMNGDGKAYFRGPNDEMLEITYQWNKEPNKKDSYIAGKVKDAYQWE